MHIAIPPKSKQFPGMQSIDGRTALPLEGTPDPAIDEKEASRP
jgi:hypothetical protein